MVPGLAYLYQDLPINDWSGVAAFVSEHATPPSKTILIYDSFTNKNEIDYYCHLNLPAIPYTPTTTMSWDQFLITQNYQRLNPSENELHSWLQREEIISFNQIFLIQYPSNAFININLVKIIEQNGYHQLSQPIEIKALNKPSLYWFGR